MRLGIMGLGFVGNTLKQVFEKEHKLFCYDPIKEGYREIQVLKNAEVVFVCVPTPMNDDGSEDLSFVHVVCKNLSEMLDNPIVCIKSTMVPGTCDELSKQYNIRISHCPEFLTEKNAYEDMKNTNRIVIGGDPDIREIIKQVHLPFYPTHKVSYIMLTNKEAEMVKITANVLLASQIGCANEIYNICGALDINYDIIKDTVLLDKRIGRFLNVPGHDGKLGFGGHCFPKDLNALIVHSRKNGYKLKVFEEIWEFNKRQRNDKI